MQSPRPVVVPPSPTKPPFPADPLDLVTVPPRLKVKDSLVYDWVIPSWTTFKSQEKQHSEIFMMGGARYRLLVFPNGNRIPDWISVFLECVDLSEEAARQADLNNDGGSADTINIDEAEADQKKDNYHCILFQTVAQNLKNDDLYVASQTVSHRYTVKDNDWGYSQAFSHISLKKPDVSPGWNTLPTSPSKATSGGDIIEKDAFKLKLIMKEIVDETGVLWHKFDDWDSKKETGCVGLLNQGATCYLNSLLQSLYFTNYFRRATYEIPTINDEPTESVAYALQRLFYHMQFDSEACGTQELTKSFGWNTAEAFHQHDVQELNRVLQDKLENSMKGTPAEGAIRKLFTGKMKSYIKCTNVDFESSRIEDFYDIQLNVKNCKNLKDSFTDYCSVETLEGDNAYFAQGFGLQTAKKGVIFKSFPPVLHLQLKRFDYDMINDRFIKINDRHEFGFELDLDEFIEDDDTAEKVKQHYKLQAVLVHSGDLNAGHYYVIARPTLNSKWYRFDDDKVFPVSDAEILEENFGGELPAQATAPRIKMGSKFFTNAYMLVYIRECDEKEILAPVEKKDIPTHLVERVQADYVIEQKRQAELRDRHLYINIYHIIDRDLFNVELEFDFGFRTDQMDAPFVRQLKVRRTATVDEFRSEIAQAYNISVQEVNLWTICQRRNNTCRLDDPITQNRTFDELQALAYRGETNIRLFVETVSRQVSLADTKSLLGPVRTITVMIKFYDPIRQFLRYLGTLTIPMNEQIASIMPFVSAYAQQPPEKLIIYEEVRLDSIEPKELGTTIEEAELMNGDILCVQVAPGSELIANLSDPSFAHAPGFYEHLKNKVLIDFIPEFPEQIGNIKSVTLTLSNAMKLSQVFEKVGQHFEHHSSNIKLSLPSGNSSKVPIKSNDTTTLGEIVNYYTYHRNGTNKVIYFDLLDISLAELESKRDIKAVVLDEHYKESAPIELRVSKLATMSDASQQIRDKLKLNDDVQFNIFEALNSRKAKTFLPTETVSILNEYASLYFEIISKTEMEPSAGTSDRMLVECFHFAKDTYRGHGIPFTILLLKGDTCDSLKERIAERISMSKKDMEKAKLCVVTKNFTHVKYYEGDEVIAWSNEEPFLIGLDHIDKNRSRLPTTGGIKIN